MDSVYLASYSQTQDILIPAYIWPDYLSVNYDRADTVTLSWQVPLPEDADLITAGILEIQRYTDPDFEVTVKSIRTLTDAAHEEMVSMERNMSHHTGNTP